MSRISLRWGKRASAPHVVYPPRFDGYPYLISRIGLLSKSVIRLSGSKGGRW
jgi:hypothetical protein